MLMTTVMLSGDEEAKFLKFFGIKPDHLCYNPAVVMGFQVIENLITWLPNFTEVYPGAFIMAQKRTTSKSRSSGRKTSGSTRRTSPKSKATRRKSTGSSTARRKTSGRSSSSQKRGSSKPSLPEIPVSSFWSNLSIDRKLDIIGVVMALIGLITLFGLLSVTNGWLMGGWVTFLGQLFGWGVYVVPVGLFIMGGWLILRNSERLPNLSIERAVGIGFLFIFTLTSLHFILQPTSVETAVAIAKDGKGGGYFGAYLQQLLVNGLGVGGAMVALFAWFLIALAVTLDRSVLALFTWVNPIILRIQDALDEWQAERAAKKIETFSPPGVDVTGLPSGGEAINKVAATPEGVGPEINLLDESKPHEWVLPQLEEILDTGEDIPIDDEFDRRRAQLIEETLASFSAPAYVVEINRGPTITQFGVEPAFIETRGRRTRVRVGKISALADDLALALAATRIRIQAPVPGKGFVGIEVPNEQVAIVALRDGIENEAFVRLKGRPLRFALGQDVAGNAVSADLAAMPHMLIAGTTGSGKSVCVNAIIACLLLNNTPDDLRMLMIDPKRVELTGYDGIPHLLAPVVTEMDRVVGALQWATREMDQRYHKFADMGARNIIEYNQRTEKKGDRKLPYMVVIIDELADLMMLAPDETERTITRMAQLARATGIHMVIATQRPSVNVVTGLIKANFPSRIAFATASGIDSRVILDQPGAERLLGRGDMLFQAPDAASPVRLQGVWVSETELLRVVQYWRGIAGYVAPASVATASGGPPDAIRPGIPLKQISMFEEMEEEEKDALYDEALDLIRRQGRASISMLQRRLRIGYTRAARLIETMEEKGIVSPAQPGAQMREVLDYGAAAPPIDEA